MKFSISNLAAESVNFCHGLTESDLPSGVSASCTNDRYDRGSRCQLSCNDPGQGFGGKSYNKIRFGSCSCTSPENCKWTLDIQPCEDINECEVKL